MKYIAFLISLFITFTVFAKNDNPQERICRISGGFFWSLEIQEPEYDQIGFCRYDSDTSLMGAIGLMEYFYHDRNLEAVKAYIATQDKSFSSCEQAGAISIQGQEINDTALWSLCLFEKDYSFIGEKTLINGWNSSKNHGLTQSMKEGIY